MNTQTQQEGWEQIVQDAFNEAMEDSKRCPDCSAYMTLTTECSPGRIITHYVCTDCGAESEEI